MNLIDQLRRDEGVRYRMYLDTLGNPTIGVGHKILPDEQRLLTVTLNDDGVNALLAHDISDKERQLMQFDWFTGLDDCRQAAIVNMAFNLGVHGLLGFPSMIHYLVTKEWNAVARECDDPNWHAQVGARSDRIAEQLRTGEWQ